MKYRILYIIPSLQKGGAERLVLDICNELIKREGLVVKLITFTDQNEYPFLTQNIDWEIISATVHLSLTKKKRLFVNQLQQSIDNYQPNVIHTHLFETELVTRSCYYPQAKWYTHCHDNMQQFSNFSIACFINKKKLTDFFEKRYLFKRYKTNGGTHFITIGNDTNSYFEDKIGSFSISKITNAIDFKKFYYKRVQDNSKKEIVITNTGSFVDKKNQVFILKIAEKLLRTNTNFCINLLGDGKNRLTLQEKAKELNVDSFVFFHGNVNNVEEYLAKSDIYLHTAIYEPLGLVLIEAMASGLPVITLDGKGNRDLIEEGRNGYMINSQNAEEFANKIIELWDNKATYWKLSNYAQEYAKRYDIKDYVDNLLELYKK